MITGKFRLKNYANWRIVYFIMTDAGDADEILDVLDDLDCSNRFMLRAERLLYSDSYNKGIAYTKYKENTSVIVISKTTSIWEFFNSFAHEIDHVEKHIAKALSFSPYSEDASYLVGEIIRGMFYSIYKKTLC